MIETNIRRVYLHHFFPREKNISDAQLLPVVARTLDVGNARQWYSALMDYGTYLATQIENPNVRSRHYTRQATFEGSDRKVRGAILRSLSSQPRLVASIMARQVREPVVRVRSLLLKLEKEGFVERCTHTGCVHNPHWELRRR
jgi:A/G-specific adenine glycosylase